MIRLVPQKDLFKAGMVARAFVLQDVTLASIDARRTVPAAQAFASQPEIKIEDSARALLLDDGKRILVTVQFGITAGLPKDDAFSPVLSVGGSFELEYHRMLEGAKFADADAQTFARINGVYNAWPYMREVVSSLFARLGYPPLTLESLVVAPQPEDAPELTTRAMNGNRVTQ